MTPDFGSEVMAEALAQRALMKPVYTIPIIPLSSSNQYRHQDHLDMKDYKKARPSKMLSVNWKRITDPFERKSVNLKLVFLPDKTLIYVLFLTTQARLLDKVLEELVPLGSQVPVRLAAVLWLCAW